jgi:hypothetical protein
LLGVQVCQPLPSRPFDGGRRKPLAADFASGLDGETGVLHSGSCEQGWWRTTHSTQSPNLARSAPPTMCRAAQRLLALVERRR